MELIAKPVTLQTRNKIKELMKKVETIEDMQEIADILDRNDRGITEPSRLFATKKTSENIFMSYFKFFGLGKSKGTCSVDIFNKILPKGYKHTVHTVTTQDGYIINMFRLFPKNSSTPNQGKPVIYMQHGLGASADSWVIAQEQQALGLMLVNAGFDVWLGNGRGTKYSYYHTSLSSDSREFWNFSWELMAKFDLPPSIKYIQKTTGIPKLMYVGHSQGTSEGFVFLSDKDTHEFANESITHFVALAPICYMTNFRQKLILALSRHKELVVQIASEIGLWQFGSANCKYSGAKKAKWDVQCSIAPKSCYKKYTFLDEFPEMDDVSRTGVYQNTKPQGMSLRSLMHYAQQITQPKENPQFTHYNFGTKELNMKHYGTPEPPVWNVGNIKARVTLYVGTGDYFATPPDVSYLKSKLVNAKSIDYEVFEKYGHTTMVLGVDNYRIMTDLVNKLKQEAGL